MKKLDMQKKLVSENELTIFQQLAIEGEVASIIDSCDTDVDKAYFTFMKLALVEEKYLFVYKQEFSKYVDESVVNDCISYRYTEILPVYLYVAKYIQDLRSMLGQDCGSVRIPKQPQVVVKSKFVVLMREILTYIPVTAKAIMDGILREEAEDLEFLKPVILVLKNINGTDSDVIEQRVGYDVKIKLLSTPLSKMPILNIIAEEERVRHQAMLESMGGEEKIKTILDGLLGLIKRGEASVEDICSDTYVDEEEDMEEEQPVEKLVHVVKKIDKSTGRVVFSKEFETQAEAADFIKGIVKDYPDIINRFYFKVELMEA